MKLEETPSASTHSQVKALKGQVATIAGPLAAGDVGVTLEIENAGVGVCFSTTMTTCTNKPTKNLCLP
jgi:hypothetical protein